MPLTKISVPHHLPAQMVLALADAVQDGLVVTCDIPPTDRFQLISRYDPDSMIIDPHFPNANRTENASIIEIILIEGRTINQKAALYGRIVDQAKIAGFAGDDIMIAVIENARFDWSAAHGQSYAKELAAKP